MSSLKLKRAVNTLVKDFLGLNEDESILILSDAKRQELGFVFFESAKKISNDSFYLELGTDYENHEQLPGIILETAKSVDSVMVVGDIPILGSRILRQISSLGIRVGILPSISEDGLARCMTADHEKMLVISSKVEHILSRTSIIRLESRNGTDISMPVKGREVFSATGILRKIGETGVIPSGKVYVSPWDEKSNGIIVVDAFIEGMGPLKNAVTIEIENGIATKITGDGEEPKNLARMLNKYGEDARTLAEFGIGINYKAILSNDFVESEISLGSCFIAFGNNILLGGNSDVPMRLSCIIEKPSVFVDDEFLINNGKLVLE